MKACRTFYFDAAHHLPDYKGGCEHVHGHTYRLEVEVEGDIKDDGMVLDFNDLKKVVNKEVIDELDHSDLNKILDNPTAENITQWIWDCLEGKIMVSRIRLWEGDRKWVEKQRQ
ncbi:MAG: 6-carboxytetrahydropterin synthase QueD [Candidatus Altiarchaeota archaeon]